MTGRMSPVLGPAGRMAVMTLASSGVILLVMAIWLGWVQWQRYDAALGVVEPRVARVTGVALAHQQISEALDGTRALLATHAYPAEIEAARAASDFQARVRDALQAVGLDLTGSQQFPTRVGPGFDELVLALSVRGGLQHVRDGLLALDAITPRVRIEQIRLQPASAIVSANTPSGDQINIQVRLVAFRLQKP